MHTLIKILTICLSLMAAYPLQAAELEFSGVLGTEVRYFPQNPAYTDQQNTQYSPSAYIQPELLLEWNGGDDQITFTPFYREDSDDAHRTHWDIRELNWLTRGETWDLILGIGKVFWGTTESRHLVDIINQTDLVENPNGKEKLGQPMAHLEWLTDWGTLSVFVLPGFRERTFPAEDARFSGPFPVDTDHPQYEAKEESQHVDAALRYAHTLGPVDLGLSYFSGTSREPVLLPIFNTSGVTLLPYYQQIHQTGLDMQITLENWLLKLEAIHQTGHGEPFTAAVGGLEYTFTGILGSAADLGLLGEYLYDDRDPITAPPTPFDEDLFLGARLALNDVQNASVVAGVVLDQETDAALYRIEGERRLGERFKVVLEGSSITGTDEENLLHAFRNDEHLSVTLLTYF